MSTYSDLITADNPVAFYRLNEAGGTVAADFSGNAHDGTYFGAANITYSKPGLLGGCDSDTAVQLSDPDYHTQAQSCGVMTPLSWQLSSTTLMSVECWVEVVTLPNSDQGHSEIVCTGLPAGTNNTGTTCCWNLQIDRFGKVAFQAQYTNVLVSQAISPAALGAGNHHLVGTYDGNVARLYIDGALVATGNPSGGLPIFAPGEPAGVNRLIAIGALPTNEPFNQAIHSFTTGYNYLPFYGVIDEVALYGYALTADQVSNHYQVGLCNPIPAPTYEVVGDDRHYFAIQVWDKTGSTLLDLPQADIESIDLQDAINGGSGQATIVFRRDFNNIGAIAFLNRVFIWFWHGGIARPANPYWAGYMVDPDQEQMVTTGKITIHLEGDATQVGRGLVSQKINPLIGGNGNLDAADYIRDLLTAYAPPGFATYSIPSAMFPLLPMQFSRQHLGSVIDTIVKTGRDDVGQMWTWRVFSNWQRRRTLLVQADQNPNNTGGLSFKVIFKHGMCAKYTINTKYRDIVNVVLVEGASDPQTGQTVSAVFEDGASVAQWDPWEDAISVPSLVNNDACRAFGEAYLDLHANPQAQGEIELWRPDPSIQSGTWIQTWETADVIKQMRVGSVRVNITPTRVVQTLDPTAPTPYLDEALYKLGMNVQSATKSLTRGLAVNTQQNYVRLGGTITAGP